MIGHPHGDNDICGPDCPVGGATGAVKLHFTETCTHAGRNVCPNCAGLSDDEVTALREYFRIRAAQETPVEGVGRG